MINDQRQPRNIPPGDIPRPGVIAPRTLRTSSGSRDIPRRSRPPDDLLAISWHLEPRDYVIAHLLAEHRFLTTTRSPPSCSPHRGPAATGSTCYANSPSSTGSCRSTPPTVGCPCTGFPAGCPPATSPSTTAGQPPAAGPSATSVTPTRRRPPGSGT